MLVSVIVIIVVVKSRPFEIGFVFKESLSGGEIAFIITVVIITGRFCIQ